MNRKILVALFGFGFAPPTGGEGGSDIPLEKRGMILAAVAKLSDYAISNNGIKKWEFECDHSITLYNQLDVLMEYLPVD